MKLLMKIRLPKSQKTIKVTAEVEETSMLEMINCSEKTKKQLLTIRDDMRTLYKDAYAFIIAIEEQRSISKCIVKSYEKLKEGF